MFQRIVIKLAGPICKCKQKDLGWGIIVIDNLYTLRILCKQCKQELRVAPAEFRAAFVLDEEYPETKPLEPSVIKDGILIDASKRFLR